MSLVFLVAGIVGSLVAAPLMEKRTANAEIGIDPVSTGSVARSKTYTVRKSVLQASPHSVCIIRDHSRAGDC